MQQPLQMNVPTRASSVGLDDRTSAGVERCNNSATVATMMVGILKGADQVRDTSKTAAEAYNGSPGTIPRLGDTRQLCTPLQLTVWYFLIQLLLSSPPSCDRWGSLPARDYPADWQEG